MPKPTDTFPDWCSDEGNFVEPAPSRLVAGWDTNQIPPSGEQNWWQRVASKWLHYLDGINAEDFTTGGVGKWTGDHEFSGDNVGFTGKNLTLALTEALLASVPDGKTFGFGTKLLSLFHVASGGNAAQVVLGVEDSGQNRPRLWLIDDNLWITQNAIYQDDDTWDRAAAGDSFAIAIGTNGDTGVGVKVFRRDAGASDGWTTVAWTVVTTALNKPELLNGDVPQSPSYENSWADTDRNSGLFVSMPGLKFWRTPTGQVRFKGGVKSGGSASTNRAFQLPVGYRPGATRCIVGVDHTHGGAARMIIHTNGDVFIVGNSDGTLSSGDHAFFDGASFDY
jgi:hypothetical protein